MVFGTTTKKEQTQLLVTVLYTHMLGCVFCLGTVNRQGWNVKTKLWGHPLGLKGFLSGFPTSPNAHDAASVEEVMRLVGAAGGVWLWGAGSFAWQLKAS